MKYSIGYRSGNSNLAVSAVASLTLAGLLYISSCFSDAPKTKEDNIGSMKDGIEDLVRDCPDSGDIEVYSSIDLSGSYILIR